jgi:hypothetical protein
MPKVWLKCSVAAEMCHGERIVTVITAGGTPVVFFAPARSVIEDVQGAHVHVTFCGQRDGFVLVAVQHDCTDVASTNFYLVLRADVQFADTHDGVTAALLPGRVTKPSRAETRANYAVARARYKELRAALEDANESTTALDELWFSMEPAVDPFIRWEVVAEEELADKSDDTHRSQ